MTDITLQNRHTLQKWVFVPLKIFLSQCSSRVNAQCERSVSVCVLFLWSSNRRHFKGHGLQSKQILEQAALAPQTANYPQTINWCQCDCFHFKIPIILHSPAVFCLLWTCMHTH